MCVCACLYIDFVPFFVHRLFSELKDWADIEFGISEGIDFVAMSFVNDADSIRNLKNYISTKSSR